MKSQQLLEAEAQWQAMPQKKRELVLYWLIGHEETARGFEKASLYHGLSAIAEAHAETASVALAARLCLLALSKAESEEP